MTICKENGDEASLGARNVRRELVFLYRDLGEDEKAIELYEDPLEDASADPQKRLDALREKALAYRKLGKDTEAEEIYWKIYEICKATYKDGSGYPAKETWTAKLDIAEFLFRRDRLKDAKIIYEEYLDECIEKQPDYFVNNGIPGTLYVIYLRLKKYEKLDAVLNQIYSVRRDKLGSCHERTIDALETIADYYRSVGEVQKVLENYNIILQAINEKSGRYFRIKRTIARVYFENRMYDQAKELYKQLSEMNSQYISHSDDEYHDLEMVAIICKKTGDYGKAKDYYKQIYEAMLLKYGEESEYTREAKRNYDSV